MITTIDKAGRIVIPKSLRTQFHLAPESQVELIAEADSIRLRTPKRESTFAEKDGVLVQKAEDTVPIDTAAFINRLREGRSLDTAGGQAQP